MYNKDSIWLLVNETFLVDDSIHDEWFEWFTTQYMEDIKKSTYTSDFVLSKINDNNPDGRTYAFQFKIKKSDFDKYNKEENLMAQRAILNEKFNDKFVSFVTALEIISD